MSEAEFQARIEKNKEYYDKFSKNVAARTDKRDYSRWIETFSSHVSGEGTILDIGCGPGIHLATFQSMGYEVLGIEPSEEMRNIAQEKGVDVIEGAFETLPTLNLPKVAGVWCAGTLLHVPKELLTSVLSDIHRVLEEGGPLFITVRLGSSAKWDRYDEESGNAERFIQLFEENELLDALAGTGFKVVASQVEESYWARPVPWISLVAVKE